MTEKIHQINEALLLEWRSKMFGMTQYDVATETGISRPTVRKALTDGLASFRTKHILKMFFESINLPEDSKESRIIELLETIIEQNKNTHKLLKKLIK